MDGWPKINKIIKHNIKYLLFSVLLGTSLLVLANQFSEEFIDTIKDKYGEYAKRRIDSWQKLIAENQDISEKEKLEVVNRYFNLLTYRSDASHWRTSDYWATPLEMLVSGAGDCEDYSIAKYYTLIKLGVDDSKLLITYVKALNYNQAHMVLTYFETPKSVPLVLDNINKTIKPATQRKDLKPVYSFNAKGLWSAKQKGLGKQFGKRKDVKKWGSMEERMKSGEIGDFVR